MNRFQPAFPRPYSDDTGGDFTVGQPAQDGMSLRAYIATQAMAAILSVPNQPWTKDHLHEAAVKAAISCADALIAELNK